MDVFRVRPALLACDGDVADVLVLYKRRARLYRHGKTVRELSDYAKDERPFRHFNLTHARAISGECYGSRADLLERRACAGCHGHGQRQFLAACDIDAPLLSGGDRHAARRVLDDRRAKRKIRPFAERHGIGKFRRRIAKRRSGSECEIRQPDVSDTAFCFCLSIGNDILALEC